MWVAEDEIGVRWIEHQWTGAQLGSVLGRLVVE